MTKNWDHREKQYAYSKNENNTVIILAGWACPIELTREAVQTITKNTQLESASILGLQLYDPYTITTLLQTLLEKYQITKATLIGHSLGALCLPKIIESFPSLTTNAISLSARPHYPAKEIQSMQKSLKKDANRCLEDFFSYYFGDKNNAKESAKQTLSHCSIDILNKGLDYLKNTALCPIPLTIKQQYYHGTRDQIAPITEMKQWIRNNQLAKYFTPLPKRGHSLKNL